MSEESTIMISRRMKHLIQPIYMLKDFQGLEEDTRRRDSELLSTELWVVVLLLVVESLCKMGRVTK